MRAYLAGQHALQERLAAETGLDVPARTRLQRQLFAWDWLSLALLLRLGARVAPRRARRPPASSSCTWPAAPATRSTRCARGRSPATRLHVVAEGRRLAGRATTPPELHAALERAPRVELGFTLVPS